MSRLIFMTRVLASLMIAAVAVGCSGDPDAETGPAEVPTCAGTDDSQSNASRLDVQQEPFGETPDGAGVTRYLLSNDKGMLVSVITYGAIVTSVEVPDREGHLDNVTLGFETIEGYTDRKNSDPYFGAICGRYANRIAKAKFRIGDDEYTLAANNSPNHLHGGNIGFNDVLWHGEPYDDGDQNSVSVKLTYYSVDGEEGYPGNLTTTVNYTLNNQNELRIDYTALSDKATPINLTNHCYWNLTGVGSDNETSDILGHELMLNCDRYLPVDETLIPTGELRAVEETPMDFTTPMTIGSRLAEVKGDAENGGYDHCYVINSWESETLRLVARVRDPETGRVMEIHSTELGVQLYTGNFLGGSAANGGFRQHAALCLECQHFPDSPNRPEFPNTIYGEGEVYKQTTVHKFSVEP